jgi:hypothetical protein
MFKDTISLVMRYLIPKIVLRFAEEGEGEGEGEGGQGNTDWKATLPNDIKADPIFEKFKEPADAFRSLVAAQKFLGREKLPVPKDENDKETFDLIFKKLGFPDSDSAYQLPTDLEIPKDLPIDENMIGEFRKIAHENRLLPSQVAGLYKWYMNSTIEAYKRMGEQRQEFTKEAENNLRKKWGAAYQQNIELAKKTFASFADEKAYAKFDKGLGNDPELIEFFANVGKVLSEDQLSGKPKGLTMTPDEAQIELNKIRGDLKGPLYDDSHPQHKEFVDKVQRLTELTLVGQ